MLGVGLTLGVASPTGSLSSFELDVLPKVGRELALLGGVSASGRTVRLHSATSITVERENQELELMLVEQRLTGIRYRQY